MASPCLLAMLPIVYTSLIAHINKAQSIHNMGYLTAEQALADYADLLIELKVNFTSI